MHFIGNMLYLWIFADNVEDVMGKKKFIFFYIFAGIVASFTQALIDINSTIPMIGASGSIAGILGSYLYLFPRAKVLVLIPFFIFFTMRISALYLLIFWFIYQFMNLGIQGSNVSLVCSHRWICIWFFYSLFFVNKPINIKVKKANRFS